MTTTPAGTSAPDPLTIAAVLGPVVFTLTWGVVGLVTGASATRSTISDLAGVGASHGGWMVAAFVVQGLGQLAAAGVAWRRPRLRWVAPALVVAGLGTLVAGAFRLPGDATAAGAAHVLATGHAAGATAAFVGLHLAVLAGALSAGVPRRLRVAAVVALAVALPDLAWFLAHLGHDGPWYGGSERTFITVLLAWCVALAWARRRGGGGR